MATENIIYKGSDEQIVLTILGNDSLALDLSTLSNLIIVLYMKENRKAVMKFSMNAIEGYEDFTGITEASGLVQITLTKTVSKDLPEGVLMAEIKAETEGLHLVDSQIEIATIRESLTKNVTFV